MSEMTFKTCCVILVIIYAKFYATPETSQQFFFASPTSSSLFFIRLLPLTTRDMHCMKARVQTLNPIYTFIQLLPPTSELAPAKQTTVSPYREMEDSLYLQTSLCWVFSLHQECVSGYLIKLIKLVLLFILRCVFLFY